MGNFDDREQKDAAVKMVGELDAEIVVLKAERDGALAVIAKLERWAENDGDLCGEEVADIIASGPSATLAEHDLAVKAEALEEFADIVHRDLRIRPDDRPVGWANRMRAQAAEIRKAT